RAENQRRWRAWTDITDREGPKRDILNLVPCYRSANIHSPREASRSRKAVKVPLTGWLDSSILWPGQPGAGQRSNRLSHNCRVLPERDGDVSIYRMLFGKVCRSTKRNAT